MRDDRIPGVLAPSALESDRVTASVLPNHAITRWCRGLVDWNRAPCGFSTASVNNSDVIDVFFCATVPGTFLPLICICTTSVTF